MKIAIGVSILQPRRASARIDQMIAVYLMLINAIVHIVGAVRSHSYNPGLVTAVILFLPFGGYAWWRIQDSGASTTADHIIGFSIGLAVHVIIVGYAIRRRTALAKLA
jgi:hypothetical protein